MPIRTACGGGVGLPLIDVLGRAVHQALRYCHSDRSAAANGDVVWSWDLKKPPIDSLSVWLLLRSTKSPAEQSQRTVGLRQSLDGEAFQGTQALVRAHSASLESGWHFTAWAACLGDSKARGESWGITVCTQTNRSLGPVFSAFPRGCPSFASNLPTRRSRSRGEAHYPIGRGQAKQIFPGR